MPEKSERRAEHDRGEDRRIRAAEVELDQHERPRGDRADARGEAVQPVEEVDHVHHRDDARDGQRRADPRRQLVHADDRERELVHPDAEADGDRCGEDLAAELLPPAQPAEVVDRADGRRDRGAEQQAAHRAG